MGYAAQVFDPLPVAVFSPFRQSIGKIANLQVPPVEYRRIQTRFKNPVSHIFINKKYIYHLHELRREPNFYLHTCENK
jgi:hypothetical protein